jgi:glycosyltransferase involved in cell wall biosynthesis
MKSVHVLLACYNGEKYLQAQLDSLLNQTFSAFHILARDDGSTDATLQILKEYQEKHPEKIKLITSSSRLGVVGNFSALLMQSSADYVFFSDQDDLWHLDKMQDFLDVIQAHEALYPQMPLLIHSDLEVVSQSLHILHPSFWQLSGLIPAKMQRFNRLLVQNCVTGCAMAINKPLRSLIGEMPEAALMHDGWIALIAAAFGKIVSMDKTTVKYRQHSANAIGAPRSFFKAVWHKLGTHPKTLKQEADELRERAAAFRQLYGLKLTLNDKESLDLFIQGKNHQWILRKWYFLKYGFFRKGIIRNIFRFFLNYPF